MHENMARKHGPTLQWCRFLKNTTRIATQEFRTSCSTVYADRHLCAHIRARCVSPGPQWQGMPPARATSGSCTSERPSLHPADSHLVVTMHASAANPHVNDASGSAAGQAAVRAVGRRRDGAHGGARRDGASGRGSVAAAAASADRWSRQAGGAGLSMLPSARLPTAPPILSLPVHRP